MIVIVASGIAVIIGRHLVRYNYIIFSSIFTRRDLLDLVLSEGHRFAEVLGCRGVANGSLWLRRWCQLRTMGSVHLASGCELICSRHWLFLWVLVLSLHLTLIMLKLISCHGPLCIRRLDFRIVSTFLSVGAPRRILSSLLLLLLFSLAIITRTLLLLNNTR